MAHKKRPIITPELLKKPIGEKCGVVAVWDRKGLAVPAARKALAAIQHRGQESAGVTVYKKKKGLLTYKGMGLVAHVLTDDVVKKLGKANAAIAHNRYSTTGKSSIINAHPVYFKNRKYAVSIGHNGNIPDVSMLLGQLKKKPKATNDTALLAALLLQNRGKYNDWFETIQRTLYDVKGAFCLVIMVEDGTMFAVRDQYGIRPLCYGRTDHGWIVVSESVGIDAVRGHFIREVKPGEIIRISVKGDLQSGFFGEPKRQKFCLFEHIYFSRADSFVNNMRIKTGREALGRSLGQKIKMNQYAIDAVVPILNSGYYAAKGVAQELGLPMIEAVVTSTYYGRMFIHPDPKKRVTIVGGKHNFVPDEIYGKNIIFIDDSAVRLVTSSAIVNGLLRAGAKKVYAGFACPPLINPCDLGIAMKSKEELLASKWEDQPLEKIEEHVATYIGAAGVAYLPLDKTIDAIGGTKRDFYSYYFGGLHPIRGKQDNFPKRTKQIQGKAKILVMISGSGTNLQKLIDLTKKDIIPASVVHVIANNADAFGLKRAKKQAIPSTVIDSRGIFKDPEKRNAFEKKIVQTIKSIQPDIIVLAGWMIVLSDTFLRAMQREEIPVINLHPALLTEKNDEKIQTSRGTIPVIRGTHAIADAFHQSLPLSGVTVHQIIPKAVYDTGPVILREEVRRANSDSLESWENRIHEAEYRVLPTAVNRVIHVMKEGVDVSKGEYKW